MRGQFSWLILLLLLSQSGCATARVEQATVGPPEKVVYVLGHGWHTGIVVKRNDIPVGMWPERDDFPDAIYLEVGWGDKDFYLAPKTTFGLALKAALQATPSVLHIVAFRIPVEVYYPQSDIIEVGLAQNNFEKLCKFIHNTYQRDANGQAIYLGRGLTAYSAFYLARGKYHLFNTCNNWVAKALQAAACPIRPGQAMTAGNVIEQTRQFGRVIRATGVSMQEMDDVPVPSDE